MANLLNTLVITTVLAMCNGLYASEKPLVINGQFSGNEPKNLSIEIGSNTSIQFTQDNSKYSGNITIPDTVNTIYFNENSYVPIKQGNNTKLNYIFNGNNTLKLNNDKIELDTIQVGINEESRTTVKLENSSDTELNLFSKLIVPKNSKLTLKGITLQI